MGWIVDGLTRDGTVGPTTEDDAARSSPWQEGADHKKCGKEGPRP
jgi:hypothetical protein